MNMDYVDEIAHPHTATGNRVTDFYFASSETQERYKVVETARPTRVVGGVAGEFRFDYVASVWGPTGWIEVVRMDQDHAEDAFGAARIAEGVLTS